MNIPNILTVSRIVMIAVAVVLSAFCGPKLQDITKGIEILRIIVMSLAFLAGVTDLLDGYLARKWNQVTDFGALMDPLADKVLVAAAMCYFVEVGRMPGWVVAIVLLREFAVSGMRLIAVEQGRVIAAAWSGKIKTACTMICLSAMLLFGQIEFVRIASGVLILITTVYSGIEYFWKNKDVFKNVD